MSWAGQRTHKVMLQTKSALFGLQHQKTLLFRSHPFSTLTSHSVHRHSVQTAPRQQPQPARKTTNKRRRTEVCFFPPTNRFSDLSPYNRLQEIQHCSVFSLAFIFQKLQFDNIGFYHTAVFLFFLVCFSPFFGFFRTASFTFLSLCVFVSTSHLPLEYLCLVQ